MNVQRHELVFVDPGCRFSIDSCQAGKTLFYEQVRAWFTRGLPCIFARQSGANGVGLKLGLALIYAGKKQRISLQLSEDAVLGYKPLPKLSEMASFFAEHYGVSPSPFDFISVYGSFLFHYLSGQAYVDQNSDLDLLVDYSNYSLNTLADLVRRLARTFKRRIDGEIRFAGFGDVAIQELMESSGRQLLVKQRDSVALIARAVLYERYPSLQAD